MRRALKRYLKARRGSALVELAFAMPVLMILLTGVIETGIFLTLNQKLQHTAVAISDLTTRDEEINEATLQDIFTAAPQIMAPFPMGTEARIIVTAAGNTTDGTPTIFWQRTGGGSLAATSQIGIEGGTPTLPTGMPLRDEETVIVTEVFFRYEPAFFALIDATTLRRTSFFRPRIGALRQVDS